MLARIQIDQFVVKIIWNVFRWQTRKYRYVTFIFLKNVSLKLLALSLALIQISFVGLLALSFPKEVDDIPQSRQDSRRKENKKIPYSSIFWLD